MAGLIKRGKKYYAVYYVGKKQKRIALETDSLQLAKEKVRQIESSLYRGEDSPLPTKTPIATVVTNYIEYMKTRKTARSVVCDTYRQGNIPHLHISGVFYVPSIIAMFTKKAGLPYVLANRLQY